MSSMVGSVITLFSFVMVKDDVQNISSYILLKYNVLRSVPECATGIALTSECPAGGEPLSPNQVEMFRPQFQSMLLFPKQPHIEQRIQLSAKVPNLQICYKHLRLCV